MSLSTDRYLLVFTSGNSTVSQVKYIQIIALFLKLRVKRNTTNQLLQTDQHKTKPLSLLNEHKTKP